MPKEKKPKLVIEATIENGEIKVSQKTNENVNIEDLIQLVSATLSSLIALVSQLRISKQVAESVAEMTGVKVRVKQVEKDPLTEMMFQ